MKTTPRRNRTVQSNCAGNYNPHRSQRTGKAAQHPADPAGYMLSMTGIQPDFHCDYGFNIHTHGLAVINYNCVILDTSPVKHQSRCLYCPGVCLGLLQSCHRPGAAQATALAPQHLLRWRKTSGSGANSTVWRRRYHQGRLRLSGQEASSP